MPTLTELREEALLSMTDLSRQSNVDFKTVKRAEEGKPVTRIKLLQILRVLSTTLGRDITIEEVQEVREE